MLIRVIFSLYLLLLVFPIYSSQHYKEKVKRLKLEKCEDCHTTNSWHEFKPDTKFDHKSTGFDLGIQHKEVECSTCHTFKTNIKEKKECKSCHFDPHKEVFEIPSDKKISNKKKDNCESCHKETSWHKVKYKHEYFSKGFILDGKHKDATCIQCHKTQNYSNAKTDCISCHTTDYIKSKWPNHKSAKFNKDCASCHTTYSWTQARYYQHESSFPILNSTHNFH